MCQLSISENQSNFDKFDHLSISYHYSAYYSEREGHLAQAQRTCLAFLAARKVSAGVLERKMA